MLYRVSADALHRFRLMLDLPRMKELSVGEQRYKAVMAVLGGGRTVTELARDWEVRRQTPHAWLARYEREGMEGMSDRSHLPTGCPLQMPAPHRGAGPGDAAQQAEGLRPNM
jgi:leucine-zipper of insertion element IS481